MNDTELSTAVRDSVADIHAVTPVEAIISRGRGVRARRRIPVAAGALIVAAGAALAAAWLVRRTAGRSEPTAEANATGTSGPAQGATGG